MSRDNIADTNPAPSSLRLPWAASAELIGISALILFLELACIRWFPAHVLFLTFFTNIVLLACFLGMSAGCLAANRGQHYLRWTPPLLLLAVAAAYAGEWDRNNIKIRYDVGWQDSPQFVFFGAEYASQDVTQFVVPIELVSGGFFLLLALAFVGPGQELGRALNRLPHRVSAYSLNIGGSLMGIVLFGTFSHWHLPPLIWFLPVVALLGYFLWRLGGSLRQQAWQAGLLLLLLIAVSPLAHRIAKSSGEQHWSPYYRVDYQPGGAIEVNLIGHQQMISRDADFPAYALPHMLARDTGRQPFRNVLIIGAGSGNDVSRALQWGAENVDAVEIDPVIQRLGERDHPDRPYQDPRVSVHLADGRNFLRATEQKYDLIVYALVDSLILHSSYSNIRLESYLFTQEALADVRQRLKPGGMFVVYNYFRQGWIVERLHESLRQTFGGEPLVLTYPFLEHVDADAAFEGFTIILAGDKQAIDPLRAAFKQHHRYTVRPNAQSALAPDSPQNGFQDAAAVEGLASGEALQFCAAKIVSTGEPVRFATDDWPFLYLRQPTIPLRPTLSSLALIAVLAVVLLVAFYPASTDRQRPVFNGRMFFLGAGFMLIETKAVVQMALLFGSTWMVNSIVFCAILAMILLANLFVHMRQPRHVWPYYVGLAVALAANLLVPLEVFLGQSAALQIAGSCLLVFSPVMFAGVIFAVSFARSPAANQAFGANIAGAMLGGLAENASMLLGFHGLLWVAVILYMLSIWEPRQARHAPNYGG